MYKTIYTCDRCGKEILERKKIILQEYSFANDRTYKTYNNIENKDICEDCLQSFIDWLEHD